MIDPVVLILQYIVGGLHIRFQDTDVCDHRHDGIDRCKKRHKQYDKRNISALRHFPERYHISTQHDQDDQQDIAQQSGGGSGEAACQDQAMLRAIDRFLLLSDLFGIIPLRARRLQCIDDPESGIELACHTVFFRTQADGGAVGLFGQHRHRQKLYHKKSCRDQPEDRLIQAHHNEKNSRRDQPENNVGQPAGHKTIGRVILLRPLHQLAGVTLFIKAQRQSQQLCHKSSCRGQCHPITQTRADRVLTPQQQDLRYDQDPNDQGTDPQ